MRIAALVDRLVSTCSSTETAQKRFLAHFNVFLVCNILSLSHNTTALSSEPLLSSGNEGFNSALKDTSLEENTVPTFKALNPNVSTEPDYLPLIATAGVFLLEANHIT